MIVAPNETRKYVVVKGIIPKSLKIEFKVFCVRNNFEMSEVLEILIQQWIQTGLPIDELPSNIPDEELEEIKGYIPKNLKEQFKFCCKQKQITMRSILYALITKYVEQSS
ncbi:hypothetical protein H6G54_14920 [Anabaena cylindrica FACHB-243]|nr:hypothetical protein [Anabaena sp. CCAP 1446/1C]MBD2418968.1 hypothetical protein [Anabaena cylindrica FACHB-243]MBY5285110.1 hypothetical protein [Anabaena sp. CCAP 1446/1C]MBY5308842.1 hypothetical protein [Anabaena sp. CCAP 1446/1C]MCM2409499.1 hypothetical protein [Anabaena sp. CCAP 1446/1C]